MVVEHRMPPQLEEWDYGGGSGQAPIRAPYSYDAISPLDRGAVVNLANFGQEIYTASMPNTNFTGMLQVARNVQFSNVSQVQHGWSMPMDGVICWGTGIEDSGAQTAQVDIWLQWTTKVKTFQAFGGVTAMNIGFQAGEYLNLEINTTATVDRPVVVLGIKWLLPDQL